MYPIPPNETLIETKTCRHCQVSFPITDKDMEFYEKVSPVFPRPPLEGGMSEGQGGSVSETMNPQSATKQADSSLTKGALKKYLIPSPTLCPDCRQRRRLTYRNERKLYKGTCNGTGKEIISLYSPDKPYKIYSQNYWWSDKWDAMDYALDFDFSKSFFGQFNDLQLKVPKIAIMNDDGMGTSENSTYCQDFAFGKNCYFVTGSWYIENALYSDCVMESKNIVDSIMVFHSNYVFEGIDCKDLYNCTYVQYCNTSNNCHFSYGLIGCNNCFGCYGLRNKSYFILNKSYSKEEYEAKKTELLRNRKEFLEEKNKLFSLLPRLSSSIFFSENSTGNNIFSSANIHYCFDIVDSQDLRYCTRVNTRAKDCMDVHQSGSLVLTYEGLTPDKTYKGAYVTYCWEGCKDIYYSDTCISCANCFGCIGLRNASYCILNRQYTREEYEALVPKIIEHMMKTGEWGEFFPSSLSPFGYNETVAQEYYPMTREEVLGNLLEKGGGTSETSDGGLAVSENSEHQSSVSPMASQLLSQGARFNWSDYEAPFPKVEKIIPADKLPDDITKIPDDILNWAIECEVTKKPFRIIKQELDFYRKHNLPIPRRHPDQRHLDRMALRNPRKLFERKCDKCGKEMITTYSPERPEKVYCEECYNKEVIG